ncbi:hypothetical protein C1646_800241 [Rhizophagus diaphanus]|nr:hypothetical protein C1646_800241 [Rhizophagus diaphanus] [Rhizophagus sp. MUCL 43196]
MEELQHKRQSQQLMPQQHGHDLFSFIRNFVLKQQSNGPITINNVKFYILEKGIFEGYFPEDFYRNQQVNGENEFIKQLYELQIAGPINVGEKPHYVISEEVYNEYHNRRQRAIQQHGEKNQVARPINANNEIIDHQRIIKELEEKCKTLQLNNQRLESERQKLKDHNDNLKKEASEYQSALGDATSYHLGNQDSDTTSQLSKDIGNLHLNLEKFCGLKKGIEINDQKEIEELLKKYECSIKGTIKENKILISGVLERYIIEIIIDKANEYFNHEENDKDNKEVDEQSDKRQQQNLEAKIVKTTKQLLEMINLFSTIRTGNDKISKSTPTKLRQQIFGILGNRGFSNTVLDESDGKEHPFVEKLRKEILDLMNRYRKIKDQEKLAEHEKLINDIIRQVVNIFFFRLKVQEPTAEWKWFPKNTGINTLTMDGPWDKDELEYLSVDICAFPLIGTNLDSAEDAKMMFPAQIVASCL